ncbi:MAG: hypothetical protein LBG52_02615 [Candidatus Peribacteria bacterium]|nr:hypothetical protein [Candidatus Peribacteria bacterium]
MYGCQAYNDNVIESSNPSLENKKLLWEQSQYDYSYLANANGVTNKYLSSLSLNDGDLQQLHTIANVLFGEYLTEVTLNWEKRNLSLVDSQLFATENAREEFYWLLIRDLHDSPGYGVDILEESPNIHILPHHIGERKEYLFLPIRVHGANQGRALYDENGNDSETESWIYYVVQLKRDVSSPYGWKIYYVSSWVNRSIFGNVVEGPWTIAPNEDDDFSLSSRSQITPTEREYLDGKINNISPVENVILRSGTSSYDNQGAASYAYLLLLRWMVLWYHKLNVI